MNMQKGLDSIIDYEPEKVIKINPKPLLKMYYYTKAATGEVSGFGKVRIERDAFVVTDIKIFKQICTGGHTEINQVALAQFIKWLDKRNEDPTTWNLWWHSHADMSVFFSGTDGNTIRELSRNTTLLSVCVNKDGEMIGRVDRDMMSSPANVVCVQRKVGRLWKRCKREVKRKVTDISWKEVRGVKSFAICDS